MDGFFVLFKTPESVHLFCKCMSSKHQDINKDIRLLLVLKVKICHENNKFVTNVYRRCKLVFSVGFLPIMKASFQK